MNRVAVVGTRTYDDYDSFKRILFQYLKDKGISLDDVILVSGCEHLQIEKNRKKGADYLAYQFSKEYFVPFLFFPPKWAKEGKHAGFIRNGHIARHCDIMIAFWDGRSKGTADSIRKATELKKCVIVHNFNEDVITL